MTSSITTAVPKKLVRVVIGAGLVAALVGGSASAPATAAPEGTSTTTAVKAAAQVIKKVVPSRFGWSSDAWQRGAIGSTLIYSPDHNLIDVTTYAQDLGYYWFISWYGNTYSATLTTTVDVFKVLPSGQRQHVSTATGSKQGKGSSISWASAFPNFGDDPHGSFVIEITARVAGMYWSSTRSSDLRVFETVKITR